MEILKAENIFKSFGTAQVLQRVNFSVSEGEIFFILGPSGCGKTTLLRIITGFTAPDRGKIFLSGKDITPLPPSKRNIGMVFQNYALWPHMNVLQNISYGLEVKHFQAKTIKEKTGKVMDITRLHPFKDKFPSQLSGGQQQRVALARAIVTEPGILLLDEPLSNLDAKLREEMRAEIRRIQENTAITMIYVTHDQKEAMSLGSRIAVMNEGNLVQTGSPMELYSKPANLFVASFLGETNILKGRVAGISDTLEIETEDSTLRVKRREGFKTGDEVNIVFRPENISLSENSNRLNAVVSNTEYYGETIKVNMRTGKNRPLCMKMFSGTFQRIEKGDKLSFGIDPSDLLIFHINERIPS